MENKSDFISNWNQKYSNEFARYSVFFFGACILISNILWFGLDKTLPKVPLFGDATYSDSLYLFDNVFCILSISLVIYSVWTRGQKFRLDWAILLFFTTFFIDLKRCNALFYFFVCVWVIYWFHIVKKTDLKSTYILFVSALYIWSGVHKIHPFFYENNYTWLMSAFDFTKQFASSHLISHSLSFLEILFGILLLFNKFRKIAIISIIGMHIFIILVLLKMDWNTMVIPWNLFMIFSLVSVFYFQFDIKNAWKLFDKKLKIFLVLSSIVMPFLFVFYAINPAFAYTMYSGRTIFGDVVFEDIDKDKIKSPYKSNIVKVDEMNSIDITDLSADSKNAPFNYSEFVYKKIFRKYTEDFSNSAYLIITKYPIQSDTAVYEYLFKDKSLNLE